MRGLSSQNVNRSTTRDSGQPSPRFLGYADLWPRDQGFRVRILHTLLGHVDVTGDPYRRGENEGPLALIGERDRGLNLDGRVLVAQSKTRMGRTSTPPNGAGTCPAIAMASSRSAASMR